MKKVFLLLFAAMATLTSFADNLASGKATLATSGNAALAADGNTNTRWESAQEDPQLWQVDLGETTAFNTISILWEGAYAKSFTIEAGNTLGDDGYLTGGTALVSVADQSLSGFPYMQNFSFAETTARYILFRGTARGTNYGYSFWEFGVYNLDKSLTLSSLNIAAASNQTTVGSTIAISAVGKDQLGGVIETGTLSWQSTNPTVGTVENGVFTALAAGTTTITATSGQITSNQVEITVAAGEKIDLMNNWQYRIYPLGSATETASLVGAFDDNDGSLWELHKTTSADEAARSYETGFIADLGAIYDVNTISIHFEGACSEAFTLSFAGNDGVFGDAVYNGGATGISNHTEKFSGENVTGARYVKFLSTKASSEWGVKIYDFSVVGVKTADVQFANPEITAGAVSETGEESVTFSLTATNANSAFVMYEVAANGVAARYFKGDSGKASTIVVDGLTSGSTYNFAIFAINANGGRSAIKELSATTAGNVFVLTAAPTPAERRANDVVSVYSNAYQPATTYNYGSWAQTTVVEPTTVDDDEMLKLTNFNYLGFEYQTQLDLSAMQYLHIDILPMQEMEFGMTPILVAGTPTENSQLVGTLKVKEWNSFDIPLSGYNMDFSNLSHQLKIDRGNGVVYVDNIYFWKEPSTVEDTEAPVMTKVEATKVRDHKATLTVSATDNIEGTLLYSVKLGEVELASRSAKAGEDLVIQLTGLTGETEYVLSVTAKDDKENVSAPMGVTFTTQKDFVLTAAPTPQHSTEEYDIYAIYSDAYTSSAPAGFFADWGGGSPVGVQLSEADQVTKIENFNYVGYQFEANPDLTGFALHVDVLSTEMSTIGITPITLAGEKSKTFEITEGQWTSLDIAATDWESPINLANTFQLKFDGGDKSTTLYVDNIYFYKKKVADQIREVAVKKAHAYYTLQGVRVAQPKAGIYVVNGKKVVVK